MFSAEAALEIKWSETFLKRITSLILKSLIQCRHQIHNHQHTKFDVCSRQI